MKKTALTAYRRFLKATAKLRGDDFLAGKIDAGQLDQIIQQNRQSLKFITDWFPSGLIAESVFRYGLSAEMEPLLNLPLDSVCTHTDLLAYFGRTAKEPVKYLELGVSIGKTLWQILNTCTSCECWGFDIEEMNPILKSQLVLQSREEWAGPPDSIKKTPASISRFTHSRTGNTVVYICADIFDPKAWELLAGMNFNLVLSDALHTSEALEFEWCQMEKVNIFNPRETVIMWDDLNGEMRDWFQAKRPAIARHLLIGTQDTGTVYMNGWLGQREFPHRLGLAIKRPTASGKA
ncbi:MAG TPA: hypothetical protein VGO57_06895 [Verrucomicrobiae bacterium]|jgi:hypothetical protein